MDFALGADSGMPQLDPRFWIAQIFWLILVFSSLYLIIWKVFLPKITDSIENESVEWNGKSFRDTESVVKNDPRWRLSLQTHKWMGIL